MVSATRRRGTAANMALYNLSYQVVRSILTIFVLLVFLGFPGTLSRLIGSGTAKLIDNASFGLQFLLILLASGEDIMSIRLVNVNFSYTLMYGFILYVIIDSILVAASLNTVLVSVVHLALTLLFALWLIDQFPMDQMLELFYSALVVNTLIVAAGVVLFPKIVFYSYQGSRTFCGLFATKNEAGSHLALGIILQVTLLKSRMSNKKPLGPLFFVILLTQFGLLVLTKNMGSILVSFVAIGYMFFYSFQKKKIRFPLCLLFIAGSVGFLFFALTILQALGPFLNSLGKDASLTGRVPLWTEAIAQLQEDHTLTGYGYMMFWRTPSAVTSFHSRFPENSWAGRYSNSMHNLLIEMWADEGLLGLGFFFVMLVVADRGIRHLSEEQYIFSSAFIVMYTVSNLTERGMIADSLFTLVLFVVVGMMHQARTEGRLKRLKKARIYSKKDPPPAAAAAPPAGKSPDWLDFRRHATSLEARTAGAPLSAEAALPAGAGGAAPSRPASSEAAAVPAGEAFPGPEAPSEAPAPPETESPPETPASQETQTLSQSPDPPETEAPPEGPASQETQTLSRGTAPRETVPRSVSSASQETQTLFHGTPPRETVPRSETPASQETETLSRDPAPQEMDVPSQGTSASRETQTLFQDPAPREREAPWKSPASPEPGSLSRDPAPRETEGPADKADPLPCGPEGASPPAFGLVPPSSFPKAERPGAGAPSQEAPAGDAPGEAALPEIPLSLFQRPEAPPETASPSFRETGAAPQVTPASFRNLPASPAGGAWSPSPSAPAGETPLDRLYRQLYEA